MQKLDDIDFIEDEITTLKQTKPAHKRSKAGTKVKVRSSVEVARDDYKRAMATHKKAIVELKRTMHLERKIAKNNIKSHRNLIASARTTYKGIKLSSKAGK